MNKSMKERFLDAEEKDSLRCQRSINRWNNQPWFIKFLDNYKVDIRYNAEWDKAEKRRNRLKKFNKKNTYE